MLDLSRIQGATVINELPLATGVNPTESGLAYARIADASGNEVVQPSTGLAGEVFVGIAYLDKHATATGTRVKYENTIPAVAPFNITVPDTTTIANLLVTNTLGVPIVPAGVVGGTLSFNAPDAGKNVLISYNYPLSAAQKNYLGISPIASAAVFVGKIALLQGFNRVFVSNFDASAAFAINTYVTLDADGMFSVGGLVSIGRCVHTPSAADPFLGIEYTTGL